MKPKKILSILCTRPAAIKMAPIVHALEKNKQFKSIVCVTGQHREMLDQVLNLFNIKPDYDLNIMKENQDLSSITAGVLNGLKTVLNDVKPDCIIVQGDTTSTMASALAAFYQKIPVAHVEAGLRTHNIYAPFPEEINRNIASRIAQFHFAPTEISKQNLLKENIDEKNIFVSGNTVIDALLWVRDKVNAVKDWSHVIGANIQKLINDNEKIILITGHRRENFGEGFNNVCAAFKALAQKNPGWHFVYPVHLNPHVQKPVNEMLSGIANFHLIKPLEYAPFVYMMDKSYLIITDSGGVQEEAPSLGKPVLVTRDVTERPEGVLAGVVLLVGTDTQKIITETESLMHDKNRYAKMSQIRNPYGDGQSAMRIVDVLANGI
ncbi:MAG: UDP-N-acetylglucosamine 2-epimerase (non-hydrolyzing) [Gammaproteobacteria bacterium]|nr:UDP-N-acetylglucosamine 2-epimerase (non-hydrolyzing) [Gammaproteobacteria bacterium]